MENIKDIGDALPQEPEPPQSQEPKLPWDLRRRIWQEYEAEQNARLVPYFDRHEEAGRELIRTRRALDDALFGDPLEEARAAVAHVRAQDEAQAASVAYHDMMEIIRRKIDLRAKIMKQKDEKPF